MTDLLASNITLMDSVACIILYGLKHNSNEMSYWMRSILETLKNKELINDYSFTQIKSPYEWVFRVLVYTLDIHREWFIFFKLTKVGDSHWLAEYRIVEHPKATNYVYSQEILDFIGTHKWRKDLGQL